MGYEVSADFPEAMQFLFEESRYKVAYGGRGGAKSWAIARALLILGLNAPLRILCARELQNSISESVHKLLKDQIELMGLQDEYDVIQTEIRGKNGTTFSFEGIRLNTNKIKSYEGIDICWVEEADKVTESSWDVLIPTIRKPGSQIWLSFNPELEKAPTFQMFVKNPRPNSIVRKISWRDNPWFTDELRAEMEHCKATDPDKYLWIWEGECKKNLDGAVYAKELRGMRLDARLRRIPVEPGCPVHTFWDLGWSDSTAIWFAQKVGFETRVVDYYHNSQQKLAHYLEVIQKKPYLVGEAWLPHDAKAKSLGTGKSIEEQVRASQLFSHVGIVPKLSLADGIDAARTFMETSWMDEFRCEDGLAALEAYRYEFDKETGLFGQKPLHDWASHGADGYRYMAIAIGKAGVRKTPLVLSQGKSLLGRLRNTPPRALGWMAQ